VEEDDCSVSFTLGQVLLSPRFCLVTKFFVQESCGNSLQISHTKGDSFAAHWYQTDPLSSKESHSLIYKTFLTVLITDLITPIWIVFSSPVNYVYVVIRPSSKPDLCDYQMQNNHNSVKNRLTSFFKMGEKLQPISSYFHALIQHKSE
jgi:hypothetical protein